MNQWCARRPAPGAARILGAAAERGSIEVGKCADLAILSQDMLAALADRIRDTGALLTMVRGRTVYRSSNSF